MELELVNYPWHDSNGTFENDPVRYDYDDTMAGSCWFTSQTGVWKTIDLISAVKDCHEGNNENLGVVLWATNEDVDSYDLRIYSSEYSETEFRPYLYVSFIPQPLSHNYCLRINQSQTSYH